jgi:hypothetical protein
MASTGKFASDYYARAFKRLSILTERQFFRSSTPASFLQVKKKGYGETTGLQHRYTLLFAIRIACPLFVDSLLRPAAAVSPGTRDCPVLLGLFVVKPGNLLRGVGGLLSIRRCRPRRMVPPEMVVPLAFTVPGHLLPGLFLLDIL